MSLRFSLKYSGHNRSGLLVYPELLTLYYPHLGKDGVILWLFLAMQAQTQPVTDTATVAHQVDLSLAQFDEALALLLQFGLVSIETAPDGGQVILVHDPLPEPEFKAIFGTEAAAAAEESGAARVTATSSSPSQTVDPFGDLLRYYEEKTGWITPKISEDLAKWVDDGFEPAVIKEAIDEMMQKADSPRYAYLNAILLSWHKNGWLTRQDLEQARAKARKDAFQGVPNAAAYREPDSEDIARIRRWKELFPDEYDA